MTKRIISSLITILMTAVAHAEVRPYALEVLVFSRPEPVQSITEVFPATEPQAPASFDLLFALNSGFKNLTPLPDSSQVLRNSVLRIQTQLNGQILFHKRWIHPLTENQQVNPWFQITSTADNGFSLNGYLRWSIDRFIEINADLRVTRAGVRKAPDGSPLDEVYVLREFRKMSSKDIHYLDHPAFGVIIAAEPIELAEPQAQPADAVSESETQPLPQAQ
jgi:hypothetical protein